MFFGTWFQEERRCWPGAELGWFADQGKWKGWQSVGVERFARAVRRVFAARPDYRSRA